MSRLQGKIAVVVGAASQSEGIGNGSAVAITFAREGAKVILVNRSREKGERLCQQIETFGGLCDIHIADATKESEVETFIGEILAKYGKIDILYNNVGGNITYAKITELDIADWQEGIDFNLTSAMLTIKYTLPSMVKKGAGTIINASSIASIRGIRDEKCSLMTYAVAKAGLGGLTRTIAAEYAPYGIRINNIIIGMVETPLIVNKQGVEVLEARRESIPMKIGGSPFDTAGAALFLASDDSKWITGTELIVDGGQSQVLTRPR